ncbi:hypothetical protein L1987_33513 [Smallanthus sonchifolius]|uniref:Uncharacterized protein n=3 Tax=Smallanthus sonchifolius TaxID=185202 RepID=A0ACB9HSG0_9ASTR|nr:hypothetical protein L1987_33511 [Smallanthus sonchifolius]KAI3798241.1 hypothetical protein L1987_33512 [Smallanthus sonchifolius]KAI3798242.1 hypothetical protein L1987_33513 [Smallanthus sonchifolius]
MRAPTRRGGPLRARLYMPIVIAFTVLGAVVEVTCKAAGEKEIVAYGKTKINGKFAITVDGLKYSKYGGAKACVAKLHMAPKGTKCNIPTNLHGGLKGAALKVKSKNDYEVLFKYQYNKKGSRMEGEV